MLYYNLFIFCQLVIFKATCGEGKGISGAFAGVLFEI